MHAMCDNKHKLNASTHSYDLKCTIYNKYKPRMTHDNKFVERSHNTEGIWIMMSNTNFDGIWLEYPELPIY